MRGHGNGIASAGLQIEATGNSVQNFLPPNKDERFEGVAFSSSGNILGVAASDTATLYLFRRGKAGHFESKPYQSIDGAASGLIYPHDLAFARLRDKEMLAVAQRGGAIVFYEKNVGDDFFRTRPVFEITGVSTKLDFSDGVAFVPPGNDYIAACNVNTNSITFYGQNSSDPIGFQLKPAFQLRHRSLSDPDGLAFSSCGTFLAVANHGNRTVSVFKRRRAIFGREKLRYGPRPVTIIRDPRLRYPHSVAFTPRTNHLIVTDAGANYFNVYMPLRSYFGSRWSHSPVLRTTLGANEVFEAVNAHNKMEGGPKGVAVHQDTLAVCSPENGLKIYPLREIGSSPS